MLSRTVPRILRTRVATQASLRSTTATPQSGAASLALRYSSPSQLTSGRSFHSATARAKGLQPDSEDPRPPNTQSSSVAGAAAHVTEPSPLTEEEYRDYSEHYFNVLIAELEKAQEEGSDVEAEYSVSSY